MKEGQDLFEWQEEYKGNTLAQELAAQIQLGLYGTVGKLARQMRSIDSFCPPLRNGGLVRKLNVNRDEKRFVTGIAAAAHHLPAWGGLLYAVGALQQELTVEGATIIRARQDSRLDAGDMTWLEYERRLEWKCLQQVYELMAAIFDSSELPTYIVVDIPLVLGRDTYAQVLEDSELNRELKVELERLRNQVNGFWNANLERCFPFNPNGPRIISLGRRRFGSLLHLLESEGSRVTPDDIDPEVVQLVKDRWQDILSVGIERLMVGLLGAEQRTAAFEFKVGQQSEWAFPKALLQQGTLGFHYLSGLRSKPVLVQTPGSAAIWEQAGGSKVLDEIASDLVALTYFDSKHAIPLPLWYAQEGVKVIKSPGPLQLYKQETLRAMREEQVEQTWLTGWEAE